MRSMHTTGMTELGEDLVEAAQILLYQRETTKRLPHAALSPDTRTRFTLSSGVESRAMRIISLRIIDEIHAHQG